MQPKPLSIQAARPKKAQEFRHMLIRERLHGATWLFPEHGAHKRRFVWAQPLFVVAASASRKLKERPLLGVFTVPHC